MLLTVTVAFAGPIDPEKAGEIAAGFWNKSATGSTLELMTKTEMSKAGCRFGSEKKDPGFYIFTPDSKQGFVIVSGDDSLSPIVGYSTTGNVGEMPEALADWLASYSSYVEDVRAGIIIPATTEAATGTRIEPMLQTSWNQSAPYNNYCPEVNRQKTPTGCTATATAQVMKFHEWPEKPKKAISWYNNITGATETIDITKNTYRWSDMLNHYRSGYTATQADAVAQLMIDVGKAMNSSYALAGTGSNNVNAARALVNVFDYSPEIKIYNRNECTYDEFIAIIRENLEARQPLVHTGHGQSYAAGHAFVCDGIDENNLVHIDWGWDGAYNGFFDLGSMSPGGSGIGGGQDRYNVGQAIIANIRPRTADEANRNGDPSLYVYEVIDAANNNAIVEKHTSEFISGNAGFRIMVQFLNWSHSTFNISFGLSITSTDGTFSKVDMQDDPSVDTEVNLSIDEAVGYYVDFNVHNSNTAHVDYLKEGTYYIEIVYNAGDGEPVKMKGENSRLILEVGKESATLSKAQPAVEVSDFKFRTTPQTQNDGMVFDVAFRNTNTNNATVVIVPIVNRLTGNTVIKSDTLTSNGVLLNVLDNTDFLATYTISNGFSSSGDHYVSFAYDLRNSYTDHTLTVDKKKLKSIAGKSEIFTLAELPDGPIPFLTSMSASSSTVGADLTVTANVRNAAVTDSPYTGTLGIFAEKDGKAVLLATKDVELAKGSSTQFKYSANNYVPVINEGTYETYVCELVNGEWTRIRQSQTYGFTLEAPSKSVLYAASRIVIDDDNVVVQGDSVNIITRIGCTGVDFDGYIRVNVLNGIIGILRSDYIPASIKNGDIADMNLRSGCKDTAPLAEWNLSVKFYDKNKRELGTMSNNVFEYPRNGYFWIADATAIDTVANESITVKADRDSIILENAVSANVFSLDGRSVYSGSAATVNVEKGIYIVTAEDDAGNTTTVKVLVK